MPANGYLMLLLHRYIPCGQTTEPGKSPAAISGDLNYVTDEIPDYTVFIHWRYCSHYTGYSLFKKTGAGCSSAFFDKRVVPVCCGT
jgi:hypothetical protein